MTRRRLDDLEELAGHVEWLRHAIHDRKIDVRLVLEGLLDALEGTIGLLPGPPKGPAPP